MALPKLRLLVGADTREVEAGLGRVQRSTRRTSDRLRVMFRRIALASAAAAAALVAAAVAMVRSSLSVIDVQTKLATSLGTTTASIQTLARAGDLAGVSMGEIEQATFQLTRRLSQAASGTGDAQKALEGLRLTAQELQRLPLDERIALIQERLAEFIPEASRAAVAAKLFGERAALTFSRIDSATLRQAADDVRDFGVAVNQTDARQIERTNDAISRMGLAWTAAGNILATLVAPALEEVANWLSENIIAMRSFLVSINALSAGTIDEINSKIERQRDVIRSIGEQLAKLQNTTGDGAARSIAFLERRLEGANDQLAEFIRQREEMEKNQITLPPLEISADEGGFSLGGSSGSKGADREAERLAAERQSLTDRVNAVRESMMTETELMGHHYIQRQALLDEALEKMAISESTHMETMEALRKDHADKVIDIEEAKRATMLGQTSSLFGALANLAMAGGKKTAGIAKTFGIAEALINTYAGATRALKDLPFPASLAAAATIIANGLANVATIASVNTSGGGNGRGAAAGGTAAAPVQQQPLDVFIQGIGPGDLISGGQLSSLFDKLVDEAGDRGIRPVFAQ